MADFTFTLCFILGLLAFVGLVACALDVILNGG